LRESFLSVARLSSFSKTKMSISPQNLTARLKNSKTLSELRKHANEHASIMSAVHDSTICVACGRFGSTSDERMRNECRVLYLLAAGMWLNRPEGSFGREARAIANILHAGAKLRVDSQNEVMRRLFDEAVRLSDGFEAQGASNTIWAAATVALEDARVINTLARACVERVREMNAQNASNALWSIATLKVSDDHVITALSQACVDRVRVFNAQEASNALWSIATLKVSDDHVITALSQACVERVREMKAQEASNAIWSIATLKVSDDRVITALSQACVERVREMKAQEASNAIWSIATLKVSDDRVITALSQACVDRVRVFNAQEASNALWSIATLKVSDDHVITALSQACVDRVKVFNAQNASNALWSIATLKVSDDHVITALTQACVDRVREMNAQDASNALWSIATLKVSDDHVITALSQACVDRVREMNAQGASNALWSAAVLSITDTAITYPLISAVSDRFKSLNQFDQAQQCLQAHYFGLTLTEDAVKHFHAVILTRAEPTSTSNSQLAVSSALTRLGYSPRLEVPIFNGVVTTDIVIEMNRSDGGKERVSIEFDGPSHYLKPAFGSRDRIGPMDGQTHLRNALLKKSGLFERLIAIPFYEWNEVQFNNEKEETYLKSKLNVVH
jgi:tellurite resistance protein